MDAKKICVLLDSQQINLFSKRIITFLTITQESIANFVEKPWLLENSRSTYTVQNKRILVYKKSDIIKKIKDLEPDMKFDLSKLFKQIWLNLIILTDFWIMFYKMKYNINEKINIGNLYKCLISQFFDQVSSKLMVAPSK